MSANASKIVVIGLSVVLFAACLTQDGYYVEKPGTAPLLGWELLVWGWMGLLGFYFTWLANPLFLVSWALLAISKYRAAFNVSLGALLLAMSFLLHTEMVTSGSNFTRIVGYGMGYWLWIASALVLVVGTGVLAFRSNTGARQEPRADELKR